MCIPKQQAHVNSRNGCISYNQIFLSDTDQQVGLGVKSAMYSWLVYIRRA